MREIIKYADSLEISVENLLMFLLNAPKMYKVYRIPKRTHGYRVIAQPTKQLKEYQRKFINIFFPYLPVHEYAMAYQKNKNIQQNAEIHKNNSYLLKMDFENFFNSITPALFWNEWENINPYIFDENEKNLFSRLLFWNPNRKRTQRENLILSIGAPSSPLISNFVMYRFDKLITQYCLDKNINYTRYADDLTFSTNIKNILYQIPVEVSKNLNLLFGNKLRINNSKTVFSSKAHNRHITGITITNNNKLSLGRERKRYIRALVHQYKYAQLEKADIQYLRGLLNFCKSIEVSFIHSLAQKYGNETLKNIMKE
ncbi:retron St85 family RNA-directed DNA polymerase [Snodgrassella communis]|jgi:RNA-directed DNA polymerase|uniref:retron St85 family RNA-directed DNA polymerase n=1 Tax=Snodgrassella communis TaxID=2946699 RepID=UPI000C1DD854|nr:retron St85 family RNA-directed DNA polymerase [Snodgrassella communis]PIT22114.1 RNA-dependent DNA polymerase [Snodgrassella communis]